MEIEITRAVALISINATLFVQLISFLIFMMLISRLMYQPLQDVVAERDRHINHMKDQIDSAEADLQDVFYQLELKSRKIKEDAYNVQHRLEKEGVLQADAVHSEIESEINRLHEEMKNEVQRQVQEVRLHLVEESERLSVTIMEKALERRLI